MTDIPLYSKTKTKTVHVTGDPSKQRPDVAYVFRYNASTEKVEIEVKAQGAAHCLHAPPLQLKPGPPQPQSQLEAQVKPQPPESKPPPPSQPPSQPQKPKPAKEVALPSLPATTIGDPEETFGPIAAVKRRKSIDELFASPPHPSSSSSSALTSTNATADSAATAIVVDHEPRRSKQATTTTVVDVVMEDAPLSHPVEPRRKQAKLATSTNNNSNANGPNRASPQQSQLVAGTGTGAAPAPQAFDITMYMSTEAPNVPLEKASAINLIPTSSSSSSSAAAAAASATAPSSSSAAAAAALLLSKDKMRVTAKLSPRELARQEAERQAARWLVEPPPPLGNETVDLPGVNGFAALVLTKPVSALTSLGDMSAQTRDVQRLYEEYEDWFGKMETLCATVQELKDVLSEAAESVRDVAVRLTQFLEQGSRRNLSIEEMKREEWMQNALKSQDVYWAKRRDYEKAIKTLDQVKKQLRVTKNALIQSIPVNRFG